MRPNTHVKLKVKRTTDTNIYYTSEKGKVRRFLQQEGESEIEVRQVQSFSDNEKTMGGEGIEPSINSL